MAEVEWMSACELLEAFKSKRLSPVEATRALLERIEIVNPKINAYVMLLSETAEAAARESEAAYMAGTARPLEGVPFAIKDNIFTKGLRTTFGSKIYQHFVPEEDAVVYERMKNAGAVPLGKTNMPEFGLIAITENPLYGKTFNPWAENRVTGGSSGGSGAAVAAGLAPIALGNDAGGSIRIPSSLCGVFGIKPQFGRIPWYPHLPGFDILHCEGPLTRSVADAALMLDVASGPDRRDFASLPERPGSFLRDMQAGIEGMRIAYSPDLGYASAVDKEVLELTRRAAAAFGEMGCRVDEIEDALPATSETDFVMSVITEILAANEERLEEYRQVGYPLYMPFLDLGDLFNSRDIARIQTHRYELWKAVRIIFDRYDLLLTPTTACAAFECQDIGPMGPPSIEGVDVGPAGWVPFTMPFNFTGQPAASVPCGFNSEGLPVGLQIVGDRFQEDVVLRAAAAFEKARPWRDSRPTI